MPGTAIIEVQTSGGNWVKVSECANRPPIIAGLMQSTFKANPNFTKLRAIDSVTKQLLDVAYRNA